MFWLVSFTLKALWPKLSFKTSPGPHCKNANFRSIRKPNFLSDTLSGKKYN